MVWGVGSGEELDVEGGDEPSDGSFRDVSDCVPGSVGATVLR